MPMFLHTADWHLGKRLHDFWLLDEQREALERLLDVIDAERPDGVLLAGDVFDAPVPPVRALQLWEWVAEQIVARRGVPLVLIPGNHDHAERLAMNARMARSAGLHVLNDLEAVHCPVRIAGVDVFGVPFHKPAHVRSLRNAASDGEQEELDADAQLGDFDYHGAMTELLSRARAARTGNVPALVLAHAFVDGGGEESPGEDTVLVGGAGGVRPDCFRGFDYAALGHLHAPRTISGTAPVAPVRYAGGLYPYAFDEPGEKSVTLVDLPDRSPDGHAPLEVAIREAPLPVRRKVRILAGEPFDAAIDRGLRAREAKAAADGEAGRGEPENEDPDDYLLVRVTDRQPIDHARARLREVYPRALLEQPQLEVLAEARTLSEDVRTMRVEDAFLEFYRHVFGEAPGELESDVLREVMTEDDDEDESDAAPDETAEASA